MSKQAVHQLIDRQLKMHEESSYLIDIIQKIRVDHDTMNCRSMYYMIKPENIGRDKFENLCNTWGFTVPKKINYCRTTNSFGVTRFDNLLINTVISGINQAFVSDITYFELERFYYLTFILDAYTRFIVGYSVSDRLTTESTSLSALKMAIKTRKNNLPHDIIFHSDGGGQYYDKAFLALTKKHFFRNSMCEYAYQNGKAERINGIIKNNYLKHKIINCYKDLEREVDRSVILYNTEKPHKALKYKTPLQIEKEQLSLQQQTKPIMTESFDASSQLNGASSPI
jgi:hypothetical protein